MKIIVEIICRYGIFYYICICKRHEAQKATNTKNISIMKISDSVSQLSFEGCKSILEDLPHVNMAQFDELDTECLADMQATIQCNLDDGLLDEIEVLIVLSGE